jgi:AIG2 family protein
MKPKFTGLMFAYGSNLNVEQMAIRCPAAVPLGRLKLANWALVFRGVADCVPETGAECWGGVWKITAACEVALDRYEGVGNGMYRKEYIAIKETPDGFRDMLIYSMNSSGIMPPAASYLKTIEQGYRDFRMPRKAWKSLRAAVTHAWDEKSPSHIERKRYMRNGRPKLAARPEAAVAA